MTIVWGAFIIVAALSVGAIGLAVTAIQEAKDASFFAQRMDFRNSGLMSVEDIAKSRAMEATASLLTDDVFKLQCDLDETTTNMVNVSTRLHILGEKLGYFWDANKNTWEKK